MASSTMGLKLGVVRFLLPTHAKQMRPRSLRAMQRLTRVYRHARTAVDADTPDKPWLF